MNQSKLRLRTLLYIAVPLALVFLFLVANRGAYEGYLHDDDLNNLGWTIYASPTDFLEGVLAPRFYPQNFRPTGHLFYHLMGKTAGLHFPPYVAVIHLLHLLSALLLWFLLRKLNAPPLAAFAGVLFFAFHMAVFDALWKPMYIFDVLCGFFCLLSLLSYAHRRFVLAFLFFWLAFKSKEHVVMLPAALACLEYWFGQQRYKRLVPFFLASLIFGLQGLFLNPNVDNAYTMRLSFAGLVRTIGFYSSLPFLVPYLGLVLILVPSSVRDRLAWFGLAFMSLLLFPLLLLPGRLFPAYFYVPLAGLALVIAACSARRHPALIAAFFLLWLPYNYKLLRENRRAALTLAHQNRAYVSGLAEFTRAQPGINHYIHDGAPAAMRVWGIEGALRYLTRDGDIEVSSLGNVNLREAAQKGSVALLTWEPSTLKLHAVSKLADEPEASYITIGRETPIWQLEDGWYPLERHFRWTRPVASARLHRPPTARQFELVVNVGPDYIKDVRLSRVEVLLDGRSIGHAEFTRNGWQTVRWDLPPATAGPVEIELRVTPAYKPTPTDPRTLGIAVGAFGFR